MAAAQHVSLRQLHKAFARGDLSVEQTIIEFRLEAARRALASSACSIGVVARRCGFVNLSHFSRRFRARYGMTPRAFQRRNLHEADRTA